MQLAVLAAFVMLIFIAAIYSVTSISVVYGQRVTEFAVSAIGSNPQTNYKVCGGLITGDTGANFGCQSLTGTVLQQYGWQFRFLDIDMDYQRTELYGCIIDDTTNMSFCDSLPLPAAGGSSLLSIDLNKPSKMPLPAHFSEERTEGNLSEEENSGESEDNDDNDEQETEIDEQNRQDENDDVNIFN